ncbi:MAG: pilin [Candidatus Nealsonbacteria bacterium]|nr:pilin [Candidatus Nealsonbacteria bacterium]
MKKLLPVLFVALFFLFSANSVLAATTCGGPIVPCGGMDGTTPQSACKFCHLFVLFNNLIQFLLLCIVPPIAVAGIVLAGVYFIFSGGNPGSIQKAKDIIRAVLIGLFIVFTAWLLVNLFFTYINVSTWTPRP